ncbi:hypothetical protein Mal15_17970 [Stieleria maiorica]|uniref:Uncharacterized protein n=1 Tax=Stieleria maiorica TaxID=2795974 RepID=A0A5B9MAN6_9BACT|nr:hypothetical protein Mal15_17970 [Stieleria maiorica]
MTVDCRSEALAAQNACVIDDASVRPSASPQFQNQVSRTSPEHRIQSAYSLSPNAPSEYHARSLRPIKPAMVNLPVTLQTLTHLPECDDAANVGGGRQKIHRLVAWPGKSRTKKGGAPWNPETERRCSIGMGWAPQLKAKLTKSNLPTGRRARQAEPPLSQPHRPIQSSHLSIPVGRKQMAPFVWTAVGLLRPPFWLVGSHFLLPAAPVGRLAVDLGSPEMLRLKQRL